ncbi:MULTISPECIES: molecular chaperone HscC [unclassified Clostridium]|uniref:molecular chaperone HscC n=1 Tax=unclassified Clostridium TaxID=2614128 RepID=UPI0002982F2C|nr:MULTISPECIES: molecular chaperone HscC [unclassified Clostridium]EKQ57341.1 MAG: molecular chaperone [Clostridium sp. Maddingley MBC34-26]
MIIGIDLGTTNSLVSYFSENGPVIIPNRFGENLTPSIVSIDEKDEIFVGNIAKERKILYPDSSAEVFKRSMGTQKKYKLGNKEFLAEELSSFVIRSLKEAAEEFLGQPVEEAIISVPAYFNDSQRKATVRAGKLAGLKVERMINEPTAAAIAYGLHNKKASTKFLVFDLGGGTFDISVLEVYKNIMEVRAVAGDNFLGGEDFTDILFNMFLKEKNIDEASLDRKTLAYIKKQAESCKLGFSASKASTMKCKINDELIEYEISLEEYEKACQLLLSKIRKPIERALSDAAIKVKEIDEIILVGGATKLPIVRNFVGKLFGMLPNTHINPDETVALGAAVQGAMKERNEAIREIVLTDVCPYTLGTNVSVQKQGKFYESGHFFPIIERNTVIPVSRTERLYTVYDNQAEIQVEILQGESRLAKNNLYLGEINIPVPRNSAGKEAIDVTYTYDINSILEVEVTVLSTKLKKRIVIQRSDSNMSEEEIEQRLQELKELKIIPREREENKLLLSRGERLYEETFGDIRRQIDLYIREFEDILDKQDRLQIEKAAKEFKEFLDEIENADLI